VQKAGALNRFAAFLGTDAGVACTALAVAACWLTPDPTFWLSVLAIVLPSAVLKRDHDRERVAAERDKAMHLKLDELIRSIATADNRFAGIEPEAEEA
jgi:low affinity Fe/Cu permease